MFLKEGLKLTGQLHVEVIESEDKPPVLCYTSPNLVVNAGITAVTHSMVGDSSNFKISKFKIGDSDVANTSSMVDLQGTNQSGIAVISSFEYPAWNQVKITFDIAKDSDFNTYTIKEFGLFTENGVLFNRVVWDQTLIKTSVFGIRGYFIITIS